MTSTARLVVIDTVWGHTGKPELQDNMPIVVLNECLAGGGSNPEDDAFVQAEIKKFLEE